MQANTVQCAEGGRIIDNLQIDNLTNFRQIDNL